MMRPLDQPRVIAIDGKLTSAPCSLNPARAAIAIGGSVWPRTEGEQNMDDNANCRRILVAEDDPLLAATVDDFLTGEGFCITLTGDGQEALEVASRAAIAALLTDLKMPRLDGVTLVRTLRASRPALPVVVMTGFAPTDWRTTLQHEGEGPLVLLDKPIKLAALLSALCQVLGTTWPSPSRS